jgi:hypothetical protein
MFAVWRVNREYKLGCRPVDHTVCLVSDCGVGRCLAFISAIDDRTRIRHLFLFILQWPKKQQYTIGLLYT